MRRWDCRQGGNTSCVARGSPVIATPDITYLLSGVEKTISCADDSNATTQALKSAPTGPLKEYEDKLKSIDLCNRGFDKSSVAELLGRSEHWVKRWWRRSPEMIPKPDVRHSPLVNNAPLSAFRDLELKRAFAATALDAKLESQETIFEALLRVADWRPARRATRDADTGKLKLRFDAMGRSMTQSKRHVAEYRKGMLLQMDLILQHVFAAGSINDTCARVFMNYYEDGEAVCPSHRHDFWTCMLSFGAERVAIIEDKPFLLRDGDLLIFGTQSHSLPAMPALSSGRLSVVVFYRPGASSIERRWATLEDKCISHEHCKSEADLEENSSCTGPMVGVLVDKELLGCPGISLKFYSGASYCATSPVTVFTIGCDDFSQSEFFGILKHYSIDFMCDLRCSNARSVQHWAGEVLRNTCNARLIHYIREPLGRKQAGGVENHIRSDEGRDILVRVVQAAMASRVVAVLGDKTDWQACTLQKAVSDELCSGKFGPVTVSHLSREGSSRHYLDVLEQSSERAQELKTYDKGPSYGLETEKLNLNLNTRSLRPRAGRWRCSTETAVCDIPQEVHVIDPMGA